MGFRKKKPVEPITEPYRKLSIPRVLLALVLLTGIGTAGYYGLPHITAEQVQASRKPWFAAYVDVTATPTFSFEQLGNTNTKDVVLSFIVASHDNACTPTWGDTFTMDQATATLDLDRRVARLRQLGGNVAISFGGLKNNELGTSCKDTSQLKAAYKSVIDRYNVSTIDIDLEQGNLTDKEAANRRAHALSEVQQEYRSTKKPLAIWVTLPVAPQGLTSDGTNAVAILLKNKVDLAGINVMTMDYGQSLQTGQTMFEGSRDALNETHRQLGVLYEQAGIHLSSESIWEKIGATPMIGQNDTQDEVFGLKDAADLNAFARSSGLARMSMWSANRDVACGDNYVDLKVVSTACSGVKQDKFAFATALRMNFDGSMAASAGVKTTADAKEPVIQDNPATSPYQIWSKNGAYLKGTKVVWHGNVYEAKWWTQGDAPDDPVLQSWETPWMLIGPVLAGEKPIRQATLPTGTYKEWSGSKEYNTGDRVMFNGTPYQAKWWNKAQSPAAASANADTSPWVALTQAQINDVINAQSSAN